MTSNSDRIRPAVVLVTGASRGIGRETVIALHRAGYRVVAASRAPLADAPPGVQVVATDIRSTSAVDEMVATTVSAHGRLDALVNVAALTHATPVELERDEDVLDLLDTNVVGALRTARAALPIMRRQGHGLILNVSSQSAHLRSPFFAAYGASKAALEHLTLSLDAEVRGFGVRAGLVVLGAVSTEILDDAIAPSAPSAYSDGLAAQVARACDAVSGGADPADVAAQIAGAIERFGTGHFAKRTVIGTDAEWAVTNGNVWPRPGSPR